MDGERELYKEESGESSNGYRGRRVIYGGDMPELRVPRTRKSGFYPKLLLLLKEEHREMEELSSLLYRQGHTMSEINEVLGLLYGQRHSDDPDQPVVHEYDGRGEGVAGAPVAGEGGSVLRSFATDGAGTTNF